MLLLRLCCFILVIHCCFFCTILLMLNPDAESTGRQVPPRLCGDSLTGLNASDWLGDRWKDSGIRVRRRLARLGKTRSDCSSSRDFCRYTQIQLHAMSISSRCTHREGDHPTDIWPVSVDSLHQSGLHRTNPENSNPSLTMPSPSPSPAERMSQYFLGKRPQPGQLTCYGQECAYKER